MQTRTQLLLAAAIAAAGLSSTTCAQGADFAAPVQIKAGDKLLGKGRLYPSPATHDLDGDGRFDIFIGDLRGHVTYALQNADGTFGDEQKLQDAAGKVLDFGNW